MSIHNDYPYANHDIHKCSPDISIKRRPTFKPQLRFCFRFRTFNRQRVLMMQEGLTMYADAKVKTARDTYALLAKSLADLKKMDC